MNTVLSRPVVPALTVLALLLVVPTTARSQEADTPRLSFHGFGTVGLVHSNEDRADFVWNPLRPNGPGYSRSVSADVDSRLGAQLTADVTPKLSAVVQVVAEQTHDDDYTPGLEWAYVDYDVTPSFSLRAGRMPVASFMVSDYRKVAYANVWMRPPVELYGLSPVSRGEAVEATYEFHWGDWSYTAQAAYGRSKGKFRGLEGAAETTEANGVWSTRHTFRRGGFTGRAGFSHGRLDIPAFDPFFDYFRLYGPEGEAIAERYEVDDTPFNFLSLGAEYDTGPWFGMAELGWADLNSVLGDKLAGYVTGGARFGPVTPYATYSIVDLLSESTADGLTTEGLPPDRAEGAEVLNFYLDLFLQGTPRQHNLAVGTRWDLRPGIAVKGQVDFIDVFENSPGTFINWQQDFEPGGSARLMSLAVAFVF